MSSSSSDRVVVVKGKKSRRDTETWKKDTVGLDHGKIFKICLKMKFTNTSDLRAATRPWLKTQVVMFYIQELLLLLVGWVTIYKGVVTLEGPTCWCWLLSNAAHRCLLPLASTCGCSLLPVAHSLAYYHCCLLPTTVTWYPLVLITSYTFCCCYALL